MGSKINRYISKQNDKTNTMFVAYIE
uniref:Uncharacterized protein n=1 Tax=Rhizophora mucronata TaxID=61149 RepID=A0A2P2NPE1_RHIMU